MSTVLLIAGDSIRALLHRRLLLGLMIVSLALSVAFSVMFSELREGFTDRATTDSTDGSAKISEAERRKAREQMESLSFAFQGFFYIVTSFGGSLVALFTFSTAVSAEIRSGTIRLTLARPVTRSQFLVGKYLGGVVVMAGYERWPAGRFSPSHSRSNWSRARP